jgi:hypothetical protein
MPSLQFDSLTVADGIAPMIKKETTHFIKAPLPLVPSSSRTLTQHKSFVGFLNEGLQIHNPLHHAKVLLRHQG